MSFGSAGDIIQALVILTKVAKALNDVDGAPAHYLEVMSFHVNMSMLVKKVHDPDKPNDNTCPNAHCKGTLVELAEQGNREWFAASSRPSAFR